MKPEIYVGLLEELKRDQRSVVAEYEEAKERCSQIAFRLQGIESAMAYIVSKTEESIESEPKPVAKQGLSAGEFSPQNQSKITFTAGAIKLLKDADKPLHASEIVKGLEGLGRFTDVKKLATNLRTDPKKRFVKVGRNIWQLREDDERGLFESDGES
jgi:hypothetical protein